MPNLSTINIDDNNYKIDLNNPIDISFQYPQNTILLSMMTTH